MKIARVFVGFISGIRSQGDGLISRNSALRLLFSYILLIAYPLADMGIVAERNADKTLTTPSWNGGTLIWPE
jgi:hypothetical protein